MVLSAVEGSLGRKKKCVLPLPLPAALWRQTPGVPFSLQWLGSMGSTRRRDRHTNGVDVHIQKHGNIKSLPAGFLQTVKTPGATPDGVICLFISPLCLYLFTHFALCLSFLFSLPSFLFLSVPLCCILQDPGVLLSIPLSALHQSLH